MNLKTTLHDHDDDGGDYDGNDTDDKNFVSKRQVKRH